MMIKNSALSALLVGAAGLAQAGPTVTYERVPSPAMSALDISPDGRFVVGAVDQDGDYLADGTYRWDRVTGEFLVLPSEGLNAVALSDDGQTIVGDMPDPADPDPELGIVAAMWEPGTPSSRVGTWQSLGYLPNASECPSRSNSYDLSADGSVVVGLSWDGCSGRGFVWNEAAGMQELQALGLGGNRASVVSADGSVVAGFAQGTFARTPAVWDGNTLLGELIDPSADLQGELTGMNDDGSIILGTAYMGAPDAVYDAVRWTPADGLEVIGTGSLLDGWAGRAQDIADDGTVIGFDHLFGNRRAWIQPQGQGDLLLLNDWVPDHGTDDLIVPTAITADGRAFVGFAIGTTRWVAWVVTVTPECAADVDGNGTLNIDDIDAFVAAFLGGDLSVDFDGNGTLNIDDIDAFIAAFLAGCP